MNAQPRIALSVIVGAAALVLALSLLAGGSLASPVTAAGPAPSLAAAAANSSSDSYNFSATHPNWNAGNLCTVTTSGANWSCQYSGSYYHHGYGHAITGCGCSGSTPLTYNFSASNIYLNITISNLNNRQDSVYINLLGDNDVVNITLSGCQGGTLNVTMVGQHLVTNLYVKASGVVASFAFYEDMDSYAAWISGYHDSVTTAFVGAFTLQNICPAKNQSRSDSGTASLTGRGDAQAFVWVNEVGYNTAANTIWSWGWNSVSFENTTTFTCSWSVAPPSHCHTGWGYSLEAASRFE